MGPTNDSEIPSSFRDPSGSLFCRDGVIHRRVNRTYKENYDFLMSSGLYEALVKADLLIPHDEALMDSAEPPETYRILKPELVEFISYPYEWCFSQLKDAALATLRIQELALEHKMCLKDASAYNIQFRKGKPLLIDTLSFERYSPGRPWAAYRQFCQHFLAPLALITYVDVRLQQLLRIHIDGIPLDLASSLLPRRTWINPALSMHLHLHARMQRRFGGKAVDTKQRRFSDTALRGLMDSLKSLIGKLSWSPHGTTWADYYEETNYTPAAAEHKARLVTEFLEATKPKNVWDLGANVGLYSRLASGRGIRTIAFDIDPAAVEKNYLEGRKKGEENLLPLMLDLTNPSPAVGWANEERLSLTARGPVEMAFALALIHHLAIANNVPFGMAAGFFSRICNWLVIEFVPKDDSQVRRLLASREDIFTDYNQQAFEREFARYFTIERSEPITDSKRSLYLMRREAK
jgi:hypothetical protein